MDPSHSFFSNAFNAMRMGDFMNPNNPLRRQMDEMHRQMDPHGDFFTNPNNLLRRHLDAMSRQMGDFSTNPNHPMRRQFDTMHRHIDPQGDFMTNPNNPLWQHLDAMGRHFASMQQGARPWQPWPNFGDGPPAAADGNHTAAAPPGKVVARVRIPPTCKLKEDATDCPVCLEGLPKGSSACRLPCLHTFHEDCLREWFLHSKTCPVCKFDLAAPGRKLRYRLADVVGFAASELRYLAGYVGIEVEAGVDRNELELAVLASPQIQVVCRQDELRAAPVGRLRHLLKSAGVKETADLVEKEDLVQALLKSGRYVEEAQAQTSSPGSPAHASAAGPVRARRPDRQRERSAPY
eukprot:gnl/TRDRNA2_/TRDRNA2_80661_c0_seq1.p1 gnl/TRDRNA2_/TRDRNA2_80661_c0~~gnl/TRDRNA2_/TRDRNA2_80661_c0_seq1.p1  ORF type:complete len:349 (+),score=64.52 gnl/TRDRNA2_/TRDRNA2_80661_c0_seq1:114-1160(+)